MSKALAVAWYLVHPYQLRNLIQWKMWHDPVHERDEAKESPELKRCFFYLDMTSRSFASVIKELHPELLVPVTLFYLILRGLDTIEDDMTIPIEEKEPHLRQFYETIEVDGWNFNGNGPDEKDRELLVHFDVVVSEFAKLKPEYKVIIKDITKRMGNGMADYAKNANHNLHGVNTVKDYELYCHYVAGLVGEGCTRLFVEAKLANPALLKRPDLHESMGQFLQQVNIIRDIREDHDDKRYFWPKEVWSKHVDKFEDLFDPKNKDKALACSSEMIMLALRRADDCLFYLAGVRDQSVFNFCAIPQTMAIATLELCFQNPKIFERNVKINRGEAAGLMLKSTQNLQLVCDVFREYGRKIHKKNNPLDPNFLNISVACGQIEVFIESIFPTQTARTLQEKKAATGQTALTPEQEEKQRKAAAEAKSDMMIMFAVVGGLMLFIFATMVSGLFCYGPQTVADFSQVVVAYFMGARFDLVWQELRSGNLFATVTGTNEVQEKVVDAAKQIKDEL